jgi:hypothetical protein
MQTMWRGEIQKKFTELKKMEHVSLLPIYRSLKGYRVSSRRSLRGSLKGVPQGGPLRESSGVP